MSSARARTRGFVILTQVLTIAALAAISSRPAVAADEDDPPGRAARLSYLRGQVSFQPAGESEWVEAIANRPLTTGDRLWTDTGARAELSTGSTTVRIDARTDFSFINLDDRIVQMQLTEGTVTVRVHRLHRDELVEVDTPNQAFSILQPGSYRIEASADGYSTLVTVRAGEGEASGGGETYTVRSGQSTRLTGTDRLDATYVRAGFDELDDWGQRRDRRSDESLSARYVSHDVVGYEDLDDNGTWRTYPSYGNVWIPTRVASGWAPYHDGHWAWISPWGYTWVDDAPWGYAPFHYGRWVTVEGRWGWVPGPVAVEAVYAPALVAFIGGPSFGLSLSVGGGGSRAEVGWFPLGPREVYVPGYNASPAYVNRVNVSNTTVSTTTITNVYSTQVTNEYRTTNIQYVNRTAPGGVTVVPQQAFTSAQPVARAAVAVNVQRIAAAPVGRTAAVAPTRSSVFGAAVSRAEGAPRPPAAVANRSVVARTPPPPPPVPFARQQQALEAHPGQPLARHEVESVRPPAAQAPPPLVRQAPPGRPAAARDASAPGAQGAPASPSAPVSPDRSARPAAPPPGAPVSPDRSARPAAPPPGAPASPDRFAKPAAPPPGAPATPDRFAKPAAQPPGAPATPDRFAKPAAQPPGAPASPDRSARPATAPSPARPPAREAVRPPSGPPSSRPEPPAARQPSPTKPAERMAREQEPPKAVARPPDRPPTPAAVAAPRPKPPPQDGKERRDGQHPPDEESPREMR